jgi:hypothetical protein
MKNHPVGVEVFHAGRWIDRQMGKWTDKHRQTDRQTVMLKLMLNFCTAF